MYHQQAFACRAPAFNRFQHDLATIVHEAGR
jgi:hypothetical protein